MSDVSDVSDVTCALATGRRTRELDTFIAIKASLLEASTRQASSGS
jgi:hypothetical protein